MGRTSFSFTKSFHGGILGTTVHIWASNAGSYDIIGRWLSISTLAASALYITLKHGRCISSIYKTSLRLTMRHFVPTPWSTLLLDKQCQHSLLAVQHSIYMVWGGWPICIVPAIVPWAVGTGSAALSVGERLGFPAAVTYRRLLQLFRSRPNHWR